MGYSGAGWKLIHEKNQKQKISRNCPFKETGSEDGLNFCGHACVDLDINKDRKRILPFLDAPPSANRYFLYI
jgi:hypothetical protein